MPAPSTQTRELPQGFDPGQGHTRLMSVDKINETDRTIELSFSSEAEVSRWGAIEILDHSPGAVDLTRLNSKGPLLFNHDLDEVIGVIEKAWIAGDGKGRALVRFSKNPEPEQVWQDVQDGILSNVSVGYRIKEIKLDQTRDDGATDVYLVTKWEPYEISIVSAPADIDVGIGRNLNPQKRNEPKQIMNRTEMIAWLATRGITVAETVTDDELKRQITEFKAVAPAAPAPTPTPEPEPQQRSVIVVGNEGGKAVEAERKRSLEIRSAGAKYGVSQAVIDKALNEGASMDAFRSIIMDEQHKRSQAVNTMGGDVGLNENDVSRFSITRLVRSMADPNDRTLREAAAFEWDVSNAARRMNPSAKGQAMVPHEILAHALGRRDIVSIKTASGYAGTVGNTVQTSLLAQSYYEILRNKATIMQGSTVLTGLQGNYDIPYMATGAANAAWLGSEDAEATGRDVTFAKKSLTPKTLACTGSITRDSIMQSSLDTEAILRRELATAVAQAIDYAGYYGTGLSGSPLGLRFTDGINYKPFTGDKPTWPELVDMETLVAEANIDAASSEYRFNANMRGYLKQTKKFASDATSMIMLEGSNQVNGYGSNMTNQIANGQVFFGDWAEFWVGMWNGLDIIVDPYTYAKRGRIEITNFQTVDFKVRREEAFTFGARTTLS